MNRILHMFFALLIFYLPMACQQPKVNEKIRPPVVAGAFYPADASTLKSTLQQFLDHAETVNVQGNAVGLWAPHAGYAYSGQVAANAYRAVQKSKFDIVIVVAPSHRVYLNGASMPDYDAYRIPLGNITVDQNVCKAIREGARQVQCVNEAHGQEHAVEVQLPFIQTVLPGTPIVPMVVGPINMNACKEIARSIAQAVRGKSVLLVASSDMSHYPNYRDACRIDGEMLDAVSSFDVERIFQKDDELMQKGAPGLDCTLCGLPALTIVMLASQLLGADSVQLLPYMNSGDTSGDHSRVVGYGAALFVDAKSDKPIKEGGVTLEEIQLKQAEKQQLFQIARQSIQSALKREKIPTFNVESENLKLKRGVFVTLTNRGQLRGCVGRFDQSLPLYDIVSQMAVSAAVDDHRFAYNPITLNELDELNIKISILSPLKKIDSIDEIEIGKHGIWVKQGGRQGTYLPEVAKELGWTKEEFLSHCCAEKAGLPTDAWKTGAEIYIYASQVLDEKDR